MADDRFKNRVMPLCGRMYRLALRVTGDPADAEDAVQDALVRLWERSDRMESISSIESYVMMTVRNCSLDIVGRRLPRADCDSEPQADDVTDALEHADRLECVRRVISTLPSRQAEVLTLRDFDGHTVDEICGETGLSAGNIRVLLSRARNRVRQYFTNR